jgi:hypothetical protein
MIKVKYFAHLSHTLTMYELHVKENQPLCFGQIEDSRTSIAGSFSHW